MIDWIEGLASGAWDKISHLFDGVPAGEPLIWAVVMVIVIVAIASNLSSTGGR